VERSSDRPAPTKNERKTIALVTLFFIAASAVLHVILGSTFRNPFPHQEASQAAEPFRIDVFHRPTPTPTPTPRPTLPPKPREPLAIARPAVKATQPARPVRPISQINPPRARSTADGFPDNAGSTPATDAPGPEVSSTPIDARDIIVSARFIKRVTPEYPQIAIEQGQEGTAIILLTIGPDGVSDVRIWTSSGSFVLDQAALRAARESTYSTPELNGEPATETYRVIYTFSLNSGVE
jgi:protein TonB